MMSGYVNDMFFSMPHGPILSTTYNLAQGKDEGTGEWRKHFSRLENPSYFVKMVKEVNTDILSSTEKGFGKYYTDAFPNTRDSVLAQISHVLCGEWEDPILIGEKRIEITKESIAQALEQEGVGKKLEQEEIDRIFRDNAVVV